MVISCFSGLTRSPRNTTMAVANEPIYASRIIKDILKVHNRGNAFTKKSPAVGGALALFKQVIA